MKISIELQPILKDKTGIGWYTYELINYMNKNKINIYGDVFNFLNRNDLSSIKQELGLKNYNTNIILPYSIYRRVWSYIPIKYNWLFKGNYDVYHFFNYIVPPNINGKVITTAYDMVYKKFPETMEKATFDRLDKELRRSVDRADIVLTISENSKREIMDYLKVPEEKIRIVYPGIDVDKYSMEIENHKLDEVKKKYNLPDKYLLYLGTLEPRKNIESIIEAFSIYKRNNRSDIKLVLGGKKGWMYDKIFEQVKMNKLEDEVIFTGYVDENDKVAIYKSAMIFIFPSLYEGFGMPVLEAMAAGVPVITSNTSSLPEVVGEAGILVEPKDIEQIARGMDLLIKDEGLRKSLIAQGNVQSQKFTWEKSAKELIQVYEELYKK